MTNDDYTTGDPIFEHGGESERSWIWVFTRSPDKYINQLIEGYAVNLRKEDADTAASSARNIFRSARELERRRLENGRDI